MDSIDKNKILQVLISVLEQQLQTAIAAADSAKEASTNSESKAENKYDTRGLEASYLASGQSKRAAELEKKIFLLKKSQVMTFATGSAIADTALVKVLINDEQEKVFFIVPCGGISIEIDGSFIHTLSIESPLGQNLWGMCEGEEFNFNGKNYEIAQVV
jgi:transcription elongation GreA/GreB family factor